MVISSVLSLLPLPPAGLFSCIMRDLANMATDSPKWIVLDGDIDPMWIESLNTVMDDNKVEKFGLPVTYIYSAMCTAPHPGSFTART